MKTKQKVMENVTVLRNNESKVKMLAHRKRHVSTDEENISFIIALKYHLKKLLNVFHFQNLSYKPRIIYSANLKLNQLRVQGLHNGQQKTKNPVM